MPYVPEATPSLPNVDPASVSIVDAMTGEPSNEPVIRPPEVMPLRPSAYVDAPTGGVDPTPTADSSPSLTPSLADPAAQKAEVSRLLEARGVAAPDVNMPILDFLQKYPQFKQDVAARTGLRVLLKDSYDFTPIQQKALIGRIMYAGYHTNVEPRFYSHQELMAAQGKAVPLATAPTLVIDDDGSENNGGPGYSQATTFWAFTNQTEMLTDSLTNNSIPYDLIVRDYGGRFPSFQTLLQYERVIYVTGQNSFSPGDRVSESRMRGYLDADGDLWMIGVMMPLVFDGAFETDNATTPPQSIFLTTYLGIASYGSFGSANPMVGTNSGFLVGRTYNMYPWIPDIADGQGTFLEYGYSLNYSSTVTKGLTIGTASNWHNESVANVVGNIRTQTANRGIALVSTFEFSYMTNASQRDDFVSRMMANLSAQPGFVYNADTDVALVELDVTPTLPGWTGDGWNLIDVTAGTLYQAYFIQFSFFVERFKEAQINVTIENYRNAPFNVDPKISLRGDDVLAPVSRSENVSLVANTAVPALGTVNVTYRFTPHRMWNQELFISMFVNNPVDTWTDNNDGSGGYLDVAGYYDGAETVRPETNASGFTRVNNAAEAEAGSWYWFTGSGAGLNNTLTMPWIDTRAFNGTNQQRSAFYIDDRLYLSFFYRGDVSGGDNLRVECRNQSAMTWAVQYNIATRTQNASGALIYYAARWGTALGNLPNGDQVDFQTFGVWIREFAGDVFIQCRLRYETVGVASTGYRIDGLGYYVVREFTMPPDFQPLPINTIVPNSPSYTVYQGATPIASGNVTGAPILINETENVTIHSEIQNTHHDSVTWTWTQSIAGQAVLPADQTTPVGTGSVTWTYSTTLGSYESLMAAAGVNQVSFTLTAKTELLNQSSVTWTIRVRDAPPVYSGPAGVTVNEDDTVCLPAGAASPWFTDPENQAITITSGSQVVNGSQVITVSDQRAVNGTICLIASSLDWHGTATLNLTGADTKGSTALASITVTVLPVNDFPRLLPAEISNLNQTQGRQNRYISFNLTLFDVDNLQSSLAVTVESNPANKWTEQRNATGNLQLFNPFPGNDMVGFNFFNVTICDPNGACIVAAFRVWIENENDAPIIATTGETRTVNQGEQFLLYIEVSDPDSIATWLPPTIFTWSDDTTLFDVTLTAGNNSGKIDFTPTNEQVGSWTVHITVRDNGNPQLPDDLQFTITVVNVNDPPVLPPYSDINVTQDVTYTAPPLKANDPDLALFDRLSQGEQESLIYSDDCPLFNIVRIDQVNVQTGQPEPAGQIRITATNAQVGDWDCRVTVTDRAGATDTIQIHIRVNNVNDAPTGVKVNVTNQTGETKTVAVDNQKVSFYEGDDLTIEVIVDDPDLHTRVNDPTMKVDPNEALTCTILVTHVPGGEVPPTGAVQKPEINPTTCTSEFTPGNNEVGIFSITFTVRDSQQISVTFRIKLEILNKPDAPTNARVLAPTEGFSLDPKQTLSLSGSVTDPDTPDSLLTYSWRVEVEGGKTYTATGKTASVAIENTQQTAKTVTITLTVTDNLDANNPLTTTKVITGTIAAGTPVETNALGGSLLYIILAVVAAAAVGAVLMLRRKKPGTPEAAPAPAPVAPAAQPPYDYSQQQGYDQGYDQNYDYSQQGYDQNYDPNTQVYDPNQPQQ